MGGTLAPDHRGQGLGAELFLAGAEFTHGHAGLQAVRAGTATTGLACRRALERAGIVPAHHTPRNPAVASSNPTGTGRDTVSRARAGHS
ncbi:GNAT family N-acetyltransferase [Streptomyces sp. NPDC093568]|uniref:GNAT family N-acetyltransferase n=1 Tax=Streptomyces sp. NPDC093568 TaxID=3366041 RepID=UPI003807DD39